MISGAHVIIYSADAEADRAFFRDVLGFPSVDAGQGWLIFALPPAEIAFHPAAENGKHEIYLTCEDVAAAIQTLERQKIKCGPVVDLGWGLLTHLSLPGGGRLGLYQPKHLVAARKEGTKPLP
ncbi:MAG: extradiol dioxygenase [Halobacteriota archaeon]|jgi:catechol 2,3-dioxygenase-like lactoylglutathione lyase family enzyme